MDHWLATAGRVQDAFGSGSWDLAPLVATVVMLLLIRSMGVRLRVPVIVGAFAAGVLWDEAAESWGAATASAIGVVVLWTGATLLHRMHPS